MTAWHAFDLTLMTLVLKGGGSKVNQLQVVDRSHADNSVYPLEIKTTELTLLLPLFLAFYCCVNA